MASKRSAPEKPIELKRLRLRDNDFLIIRDTGDHRHFREDILKRLKLSTKANVTVIFVKQLSDVRLLTSEQMERIGLKRVDDDS